MKFLKSNRFVASFALLTGGTAAPLQAAHPIAVPPQVYGPLDGSITLTLGFTAERIEGGANLLTPLYRAADGNTMFFLDGNWSGKGDANENGSAGLGYRHRFTDPDIIFGLNAFYDYGDYSGRGYHQAGVGLELLSKWVDFRANAYFVSNDAQPIACRTATFSSSKKRVSSASRTATIDGGEGDFDNDNNLIRPATFVKTTVTNTHRSNQRVRRVYQAFEGAMPGFDLELGGLVPYLDRWAEVRVYAGYSWFDDPFGNDVSCLTARLEARPVPAVILDAQYKGDSRLLDFDNLWYFGARVEIPFDLGNLLSGQSPFAGITQAFTPKWLGSSGSAGPVGNGKDGKDPGDPGEMARNRMNENIIRTWRPTVSRTGFRPVSQEIERHHSDRTTTTTTQTAGQVVIPLGPVQ